ncbi:MAG: WecB/TagA/CpsF family glycosyltransferase, partial [Thermoleophilia bacterium]|nr:WecB/TagA/CpsF family glycosyltransferase [Thermoleophilia bacterium]
MPKERGRCAARRRPGHAQGSYCSRRAGRSLHGQVKRGQERAGSFVRGGPDAGSLVRDTPRAGTLLELATSCQPGDLLTAAREIVERAHRRRGGYVCLCNVHLVTTALRDDGVRLALDGAWRRFADGAPIAWLQRRAGSAGARRVGGPDLMPTVIDIGRASRLRHYLLGSTPETLARVEATLRSRYPGVEIVGASSPPFASEVEVSPAVLDAIRDADPEIVWCALGAPKQELWMHQASPSLPTQLLVGVGAAFDFLAGSKPRAPLWMQHGGLEWLHRLMTEPKRLGGRYLRTNTEFVVRAVVELV